MHRVEAVQRNRANVCGTNDVWKGQNRGCQSFPGYGSGRDISCDSIRSSSWSTISFLLWLFIVFLNIKFIFERVELLKREFQFYDYGSSDVNTDFVNGGHNIIARVFVLRNFFLIVWWLWNRKEKVYEIKNFWNKGRWRWVNWNFRR